MLLMLKLLQNLINIMAVIVCKEKGNYFYTLRRCGGIESVIIID
jgi:hypothetical protein